MAARAPEFCLMQWVYWQRYRVGKANGQAPRGWPGLPGGAIGKSTLPGANNAWGAWTSGPANWRQAGLWTFAQ